MNKYLIVLVDYSDGIYHVASRPKYVVDDMGTAQAASNLLNEVANHKDCDEDGEWWGDHYAVRSVEVWGSDGGA
jgi:hypothetical protein